ncbi:uncharacterized protein BT62DRAFT_1025728, partial [Guyanagaster necrorhizus]
MSAPEEQQHPVLGYQHFYSRIENQDIQRQYVVRDSPIDTALNNVASLPFVSFTLEAYISECDFISPGGTSLGTLGQPDIDMIRSKSRASSFSRGDEIVLDPAYRDGQEIDAEESKYSFSDTGSFDDIVYPLKIALGSTLFIGKEVDVRPYKVALYDKGGHSDWYYDSRRGDHHATVLVALNTPWKGGALHLRNGGEEMTVDMRPRTEIREGWSTPETHIHLKAAAFKADVAHKFEPIEEGVQIILQCDAIVSSQSDAPHSNVGGCSSTLDTVAFNSRLGCHRSYVPEIQVPAFRPNEAFLSKLVEEIQGAITTRTKEIGIPLRYLYQQASISKEYLKGIDAVIYSRLSEVFDVELAPVILDETSED